MRAVDINTASLKQLEMLTEIGPKKAQAIVDARPFSSVDDLIRVKGIGEKTLQKIKEQGLACVSCAQETEEISNSQFSISNKFPNAPISNDDTAAPAKPAPPTYPVRIFINEILPNPEGTDEQNEWIELYNSNSFNVDLSGWKIKDVEGFVKTYSISRGIKILANGFLVFKRPDTKIILNNEEDGLELIAPNGKIIDSVKYTKAPLGQSYNRTDSGWQWSGSLTPGSENIVASASKNLPKTEKSDKNEIAEKGLASINQPANPWFLFFIALAITIILATITLFIKFKLKNKNP